MKQRRNRAEMSSLLRLAEGAADEAKYLRVGELFAQALTSGISADSEEDWALLLAEAGCFDLLEEWKGAAMRLAEMASTPPPPVLQVELAADDDEPPDTAPDLDFIDFEPGGRAMSRVVGPSPLAETLQRVFGGRADVYAKQWYDAGKDRSGYWPVREPLTAEVLMEHVEGRVTVGQYVLHVDATVSFAALDLDPTAEAIGQMRVATEGSGPLNYPPLCEYARRLIATATALGLHPIGEDSGGVGIHVWILFAPRVPAAKARALLREILWRAGAQPPTVNVEVFPKQEKLSGKGLGNLIKLPLGVHQVTQRRSVLLDEDMLPLPTERAIRLLVASDPAAVEAAAAPKVVPLRQSGLGTTPEGSNEGATEAEASPTLRIRGTPRRGKPLPPTNGRTLAVALAGVAPARAASDAFGAVVEGCFVVRELVRRAHEDHALRPDEARALLYTVGLIGRENPRVDELFATASVSRSELDRVRRGLPSPAGCRGIRLLCPDEARQCACPPPPAGLYATPALFALSGPPPVSAQPASLDPERFLSAIEAELPASPTAGIDKRLDRIEEALRRLAEVVEGQAGEPSR